MLDEIAEGGAGRRTRFRSYNDTAVTQSGADAVLANFEMFFLAHFVLAGS